MAELPFFPRAVTYLFQNSKLFQQTRTTICLTGDEHRPNYNLHTTLGYHPTIYIYPTPMINPIVAGSISIPDVFPCYFF